jgi:hypothetical protein
MDIKRKTYYIRTWRKHLFLDVSSTNIDTLVPSLYQCVEARSIEVFWLLSQPLPHLRFNLYVIRETFATQWWTALRYKHFSPWTGHISLWLSFALSHFAHKKKRTNRTLLFGRTLLKHSRHFDSWNQPLDMRMRVFYRNCHEVGLCWRYTQKTYYVHYSCFTSICDWTVLVIHTENLIHPLQLFYFHLWPIYWLSLVLLTLATYFRKRNGWCSVDHVGCWISKNNGNPVLTKLAFRVGPLVRRPFFPEDTVTHMVSARQRLGKHVPEVTLSTTE